MANAAAAPEQRDRRSLAALRTVSTCLLKTTDYGALPGAYRRPLRLALGVALQPLAEYLAIALQGLIVEVEHAGLAAPLAAFVQRRLPR